MTNFVSEDGVYIKRLNIDIADGVYVADTDLYLSAGAEVEMQRIANRIAVYKRIAQRLVLSGQKTFVIISQDAEHQIGGELKSTLRKCLTNVVYILTNCDGFYDAEEIMKANDDVRSIFAVGNGEAVMLAKKIATNYDLPLYVYLTVPDSDDILAPYYIIKEEFRAYAHYSVVPRFVMFNLADELYDNDLRCGVGRIAKTLLTLFELDYLKMTEFRSKILDIIKNCLFVDFTKNTIETKKLLYVSLLSLSLLKNEKNNMLITGVDGFINTLDYFGINGKEYSFVCAKLISDIYLSALSQKELSLCLPPDTMQQYSILSTFGIAHNKTDSVLPFNPTFALPNMFDKVTSLNQSLSLFDNYCIETAIPLPKSTLYDALSASLTLNKNQSFLLDLFQNGFILT